jgi:hypothetical protein
MWCWTLNAPFVVPGQDRADRPPRHRCPAVVHVVRADHRHRRRLCQPDEGLDAAVLGVRQGPHRQHLLEPGAVPLRRPGPAPLHRMSTSGFTIAYSNTCNAYPRTPMVDSKYETPELKYRLRSRRSRHDGKQRLTRTSMGEDRWNRKSRHQKMVNRSGGNHSYKWITHNSHSYIVKQSCQESGQDIYRRKAATI